MTTDSQFPTGCGLCLMTDGPEPVPPALAACRGLQPLQSLSVEALLPGLPPAGVPMREVQAAAPGELFPAGIPVLLWFRGRTRFLPLLLKRLGTVRTAVLLPPAFADSATQADSIRRLLKHQHQPGLVASRLAVHPAAARLLEIVTSGAPGTLRTVEFRLGCAQSDGDSDAAAARGRLTEALALVLSLLSGAVVPAEPAGAPPVAGCVAIRAKAGAVDIAGTMEPDPAPGLAVRLGGDAGSVSAFFPLGAEAQASVAFENDGRRRSYPVPAASPELLLAATALHCVRTGLDYLPLSLALFHRAVAWRDWIWPRAASVER